MKIEAVTGSEWHTSHGAKGFVFVVSDGQEQHIHESKQVTKLDIDWTNVQNGKHGRWATTLYEVPPGTILKLFAIATYRGRPNGGGGGYFIVDPSVPEIQATGGDYSGRGGSLCGHLQPIPLDDLPQYGINVTADHRRYYKDKLGIRQLA